MPRASPDQPADSPSTAHSDSPPPPHDPAKPFCAQCHAFTLSRLSESEKYTKRVYCDVHRRERKRFIVYGTPERKAVNYLRSLARQDRQTFNQPHIKISKGCILALLSKEQLLDFNNWSIVPKDPLRILSVGNALLIKKATRRYLMCDWKRHKDPVQYEHTLSALMGSMEI